MKVIKSKKKVNACAFLRTFPRRCEIFPLRHGRGGRARRRGGEKNVGTFFENKGTFLGKWGGKGENPWAFRTDLGRRARDLGGMARREGVLVVRRGGGSGCTVGEKAHGLGEMARRGDALGVRRGGRNGRTAAEKARRRWGNGATRRRVGGAHRQEWAHRGRKGAQEAAVQEIMRIFVAD